MLARVPDDDSMARDVIRYDRTVQRHLAGQHPAYRQLLRAARDDRASFDALARRLLPHHGGRYRNHVHPLAWLAWWDTRKTRPEERGQLAVARGADDHQQQRRTLDGAEWCRVRGRFIRAMRAGTLDDLCGPAGGPSSGALSAGALSAGALSAGGPSSGGCSSAGPGDTPDTGTHGAATSAGCAK